MDSIYKIILVDDHKLFRDGLSFGISRMEDFTIVAEFSTGEEFLARLGEVTADIVIMDISMPGINGITATEKALKIKPDLRIIALTMFCDVEYYNKMIEAGVKGYILKDSGIDELSRALRAVAAGDQYFSQKLLYNLILNSGQRKPEARVSSAHQESKITQREKELLKLICQGYSNLQISKMLSISIHSIEDTKTELFAKTGSKDTLNLAIYALKNKLVEV